MQILLHWFFYHLLAWSCRCFFHFSIFLLLNGNGIWFDSLAIIWHEPLITSKLFHWKHGSISLNIVPSRYTKLRKLPDYAKEFQSVPYVSVKWREPEWKMPDEKRPWIWWEYSRSGMFLVVVMMLQRFVVDIVSLRYLVERVFGGYVLINYQEQ